MTKRPSKKGLPKALQAEEDIANSKAAEPSLAEFVADLHGEGVNPNAEPQDGFPTREWLQEQFKTKSAVIRYLISQGKEVKLIAKHLGMRYQHVRNVAKSELKRGPNEDWRKPYLEGTMIPDAKDFKPKDSE